MLSIQIRIITHTDGSGETTPYVFADSISALGWITKFTYDLIIWKKGIPPWPSSKFTPTPESIKRLTSLRTDAVECRDAVTDLLDALILIHQHPEKTELSPDAVSTLVDITWRNFIDTLDGNPITDTHQTLEIPDEYLILSSTVISAKHDRIPVFPPGTMTLPCFTTNPPTPTLRPVTDITLRLPGHLPIHL